MKKTWKRLCTGFLALVTVVTALPTTPVHAESKQYWTESKERVGIVEKVMNDCVCRGRPRSHLGTDPEPGIYEAAERDGNGKADCI